MISIASQFLKKQRGICLLHLIIIVSSVSHAQVQMSMKIPAHLQKGDTVALVATARKNVEDNLKPAINLLNSWGLNVIVGRSIGLNNNQLAGTDKERASDFQEQLDNPTIKAIWCVRGGYGTVRILEHLDFTKFQQQPKWIIGFSDVTVLHSHINTLRVATIHGVMPVTIANATPEAIESMRKALFGEKISYQLPFEAENKLGKASGEIVGGNLSIIYSLMGSTAQVDCKGKILFLEDLDEYLYHIDRMMMGLDRCGCFDKLQGLILGGMTKMKDNEIPWGKNAYQIVAERTEKYKFPILFDFPAGHIRDNRALIFGKQINLDVNKNSSIVVLD